jgi:hypothetical protein
MKKFFLFKRKDVNSASTTASDSGEGLDILAVSVDQLAFMTASLGKVNIVFNDATIYEENNLLDGESFKKTSVSVACEQGGEAALIDSILGFISSDRTKTNVMRFDAVSGSTNVKEANISSFTDIVSEVREKPVMRTTQNSSTNTFIGGTAGTAFGTGNVVGGIDFGEGNKPVIDFIEDNITESAGNVTGWTNAGTGGSQYDVDSIGGTLAYDDQTGRANNGLATVAADFQGTNNVRLAKAYRKSGEFTMFIVIGKSTTDIDDNPKLGPLVQGSTTSGSSLTFAFANAYDNDTYHIKFADEKGESVQLDSANPIIDTILPPETRRTTYVFVIRRDASNTIYINTNSGDLDAFAPPKTEGNSARTDGDLVVKYLGNGLGEKFLGNVARFGVIDRDIGTSAGSDLARDLASIYTPLT